MDSCARVLVSGGRVGFMMDMYLSTSLRRSTMSWYAAKMIGMSGSTLEPTIHVGTERGTFRVEVVDRHCPDLILGSNHVLSLNSGEGVIESIEAMRLIVPTFSGFFCKTTTVAHSNVCVMFDGGSRGNPGPAGYGFCIYSDKGMPLCYGYGFMGDAKTNNEAEYSGLLHGLYASRMLGATQVSISGDSLLIIEQLRGKYKVKSPKLKPYYTEAKDLLLSFPEHALRQIPRAENHVADRLANTAMDLQQSRLSFYPFDNSVVM